MVCRNGYIRALQRINDFMFPAHIMSRLKNMSERRTPQHISVTSIVLAPKGQVGVPACNQGKTERQLDPGNSFNQPIRHFFYVNAFDHDNFLLTLILASNLVSKAINSRVSVL